MKMPPKRSKESCRKGSFPRPNLHLTSIQTMKAKVALVQAPMPPQWYLWRYRQHQWRYLRPQPSPLKNKQKWAKKTQYSLDAEEEVHAWVPARETQALDHQTHRLQEDRKEEQELRGSTISGSYMPNSQRLPIHGLTEFFLLRWHLLLILMARSIYSAKSIR